MSDKCQEGQDYEYNAANEDEVIGCLIQSVLFNQVSQSRLLYQLLDSVIYASLRRRCATLICILGTHD